MVAHNAPTLRLPAVALTDDTSTAPAPRSSWMWRVLRLLAVSPAGLGLVLLATGCGVEGEPLIDATKPVEEVFVPFADTGLDNQAPRHEEAPAQGEMGSRMPSPTPDEDPGMRIELSGVPRQGAPSRQVGFPDAPGEEETTKEPETEQPTPPPAKDDAAKPCSTDADCPALAGGCLIQACQTDDQGAGVCAQVAFVCQCIPGQHTSCDDKNPCTTDTCSDVGACSYDTTTACDDGNACTEDACEAKTYEGIDPVALCTHKADDALTCDDGDLCTETSTCSAGGCVAGELAECTDNDPCTFDTCDSGKGCVFVALSSCGG